MAQSLLRSNDKPFTAIDAGALKAYLKNPKIYNLMTILDQFAPASLFSKIKNKRIKVLNKWLQG